MTISAGWKSPATDLMTNRQTSAMERCIQRVRKGNSRVPTVRRRYGQKLQDCTIERGHVYINEQYVYIHTNIRL